MTTKQIKKIGVDYVDSIVDQIEEIDARMSTPSSLPIQVMFAISARREILVKSYHTYCKKIEFVIDTKRAILLALTSVSESITRFGYHKNHLACLNSITNCANFGEYADEMSISVGCLLGSIELEHKHKKVELPNSLTAENFNKKLIDGGVFQMEKPGPVALGYNIPKSERSVDYVFSSENNAEPIAKFSDLYSTGKRMEKRKIEFIGKRLTESHLGKAVYRRSVTVEGAPYILVDSNSVYNYGCDEWNAISDKAGHAHCVVFMQGPGGVGLQTDGIIHSKSGRVYIQARDYRTVIEFGPEWFTSLIVTLKEDDDSHGL